MTHQVSRDQDISYDYWDSGREEYNDILQAAGYVELEGFIASMKNYCCFSCEYMQPTESSPTGFFCTKIKAPDRPDGCCDKYEFKGSE